MTSKLTRERLQEIAEDGFLKHGESKELARMALAAMDSEPAAWTDEQELRDVEKDGCGYLFKANPITPHADPRRVILLYRHAQQPGVPDDLLSMAASAIEDLLEHTDPNTSYYSGVWSDVPGKLRAAMLNGGKS